jgi:hypothetical protein
MVRKQLSDFAEKHEAAAPEFIDLVSPIPESTAGVDSALGGVARSLLEQLPHSDELMPIDANQEV